MSEWKEYRLGDILSIKSGFSYKGKYIGTGDSLLLGMGCVSFKDKFLMSGARPYSGPYDDRYKVHSGDIVLATRQQSDNLPILAMPAMVPESLEGKDIVIGTNLYKVEITDYTFSNVFIYWLLKTKQYVNYIAGVKTGTTVSMVTKKNVEDFTFLAPTNPKEREEIVSIISSLDDKIAVNRRICENLEAQAQALFKHWFIDFAPFKNGKFVESELGMIPEGWRVVTLDEATSKFGTGLNPRKNFKLGFGNNYYVTIKNMIDNRVILDNKCDFVDDEAIKIIQKRSKLTKGDLLFSGIGTIGRVAIVVDEPLNWNTSESVFNMHPAEGFSTEFLYVLLLSKQLQNYVKINSQGAVQQGIRMASLKAYKFSYPKYEIKEFNLLLKDIISKKTIIEKESDILATLRDTLLPKLMSGQIKVNETEKSL